MNENTEKLIRELSEKLGATAEHLWSVMIKQAAIDSSISIIQCILLIWLVIASFKYFKRKHSEDEHELMGVVWCFWGLVSMLIVMSILFGLDDILTGFVNPEYWALKQLLPK